MTKIRSQAKRIIDDLPEERLKTALTFLEFIEEKERWEATKELLEIPGMAESFRRGKRDILADRTIPWKKSARPRV